MAVPAPQTTDPANLAGTEAQTAASPALSPETFTATTATTPGQIPSVDPVATEILTATAVLTTTAGTSATKTLTATEVLSETEATGLLPEGLTETAVLSASEILTATEIVSETSAAITPEPAVLPTVSPWLTQLTLMTSVTPTSAYAGMFNRLEYVLVMTGTGAVKLEITLPPEVLIDPTRLPIDTGYDETQRTIGSWVDLDTVSPYHFRFEALTDLLTRPGNVRFKTIAYPAAVVEPTIEVAEVTLLPYQKTVDLAGEAAATTNEPADP
jgi:hypothetical protein